jgi:uncharacterized surface protein with fasciclin (FAS1) repeats
MKLTGRRTLAVIVTAAAVSLTTAACGSDDGKDTTSSGRTSSSTTPEEQTPSDDQQTPHDDETTPSGMSNDAAGLVGPGCAAYAAAVPTGEGSVEGMSDDPVVVAASNNPFLTTLVSAVSGQVNAEVNLVDTLNNGEFTVFAPVDEAFDKVDQATMNSMATDPDLLTSVITYHVVPGQLSPDQVIGEQTSVQGGTLTVAGTPDAMTVNDAHVICGGVATANATVYLIDTVLTPPT